MLIFKSTVKICQAMVWLITFENINFELQKNKLTTMAVQLFWCSI